MHSVYYDDDKVREVISKEGHRNVVGGMWDELGDLQLSMLVSRGLLPQHRVLDIGCGAMRFGRKACAYLNPGNYWGTDLSDALLNEGYTREILDGGLSARLPRGNLVHDGEFLLDGVPREFEFVVAQSVFTHLPLNHLRQCLARLAAHLTTPSEFYFTIFEPTDGTGPAESCRQPVGGVVSHPFRDPYHYTRDDIVHAARNLPWSVEFIGDWGHPRNQKLIKASLKR